ncbi:putative DNA-binding pseudobarrel domain superfamily [Helianthus annuus]|nr:putative DNA-binding pseudobarrel domain superfamily [Helianthus annuus]
MMWGEHPPYNESVKIVDGNNIWFVRLKRTALGPVLGDGFTKVVRDSGITKNDYLLFQSFGPSSFFVSVLKSCVHENCFISKIKPEDDVIVMDDEFWRQFYGKIFKGGESTLYVRDIFWNVKVDRLSDSCVFTHGCSEMVNDIALDMGGLPLSFQWLDIKLSRFLSLIIKPVLKFNSRRLTSLFWMTRFMVMMVMKWLLRLNISGSLVMPELMVSKVLLWIMKMTDFSFQLLSRSSM